MPVTTTGRRRTRTSGNDGTVSDMPKSNPTKADLQAEIDRAKSARTKRHEAVREAISIVQIPLAAAATVEQSRLEEGEIGSFTLDLWTVDQYTAPAADVLCDLAEAYPVLGLVLDKVAKASPFGALLSLGVSMVAQFAENHRALPSHLRTVSPNLVDRDDLVGHLEKEAAKAQAKAQAEADAKPDRNSGNGLRHPSDGTTVSN